MPLLRSRLPRDIGHMEFIAIALIGLYLFALVRVLRDDRPRQIPGSHYSPPANANEVWSRITQGSSVI